MSLHNVNISSMIRVGQQQTQYNSALAAAFSLRVLFYLLHYFFNELWIIFNRENIQNITVVLTAKIWIIY